MPDLRSRFGKRSATSITSLGQRLSGGPRAHGGLAQFGRPRWLALHVLFVGLAVGMVFLGRWQLDVSDGKHFDLQNFSYAFQWWAFSAVALAFWVKIIHDAWRPPPTVTGTGGELVLRGGGTAAVARAGPVNLVSVPAGTAQPVVYRGYAMPQSADGPVRDVGDEHNAAYNDYLWQLAMTDGVTGPAVTRPAATPDPARPPLNPAIEPGAGRPD